MEIDLGLIVFSTPITVGLVAAVRQTNLDNRWLGLVSVAVGMGVCILGVAAGISTINYGEAALCGVVTGLSASGLWSGTKAALSR